MLICLTRFGWKDIHILCSCCTWCVWHVWMYSCFCYIISVFLIASIFTVIAIGVLDGTIIVYHPMTMTLSTSKLTLFVLNIFYLFIIFGLLIFHPSAFTNMCSLSHWLPYHLGRHFTHWKPLSPLPKALASPSFCLYTQIRCMNMLVWKGSSCF